MPACWPGVSEPGNGADNFHGYEISLAADGRKVVLGKHKNNFTPIADAAVSCDPHNGTGWDSRPTAARCRFS